MRKVGPGGRSHLRFAKVGPGGRSFASPQPFG